MSKRRAGSRQEVAAAAAGISLSRAYGESDFGFNLNNNGSWLSTQPDHHAAAI
jgi:hypothetical protein